MVHKKYRGIIIPLVLLILSLLALYIYKGLAPGNVKLHPLNGHLQIKVSWEKGILPEKYDVYRRILPEGRVDKIYSGDTRFFIDSSAKPGRTYAYKVVNSNIPLITSDWVVLRLSDRFFTLREQLFKLVDNHFQQFTGKGEKLKNSPVAVSSKRWIYDDALGILVYTVANEQSKAGQILDNLVKIQNSDGSINFFYYTSGEESERYIRNGALAWVGYAAAVYEKKFGDRKFRPFTEKIAVYLVNCGADKGMVTGGEGSYLDDNEYRPGKVKWHSTEHNLDTYYFFREMAQNSGEPKYARYAEKIHERLITEFWIEQGGYFKTGSNDNSVYLDNVTWGGVFLLGQDKQDRAVRMAEKLKKFSTSYATDKTVLTGYTDPILFEQVPGGNNIWVEGTFGAILYLMRMGEDVEALLDSMEKAFYTTDTKLSDQAWGYIVLEDNEFLWAEK